MSIKQYESYKVNELGHLTIGGIDTVDLAKHYDTPLYVYDVTRIRQNARIFKDALKTLGVRGQIAYASKAFSTIAMLQIIKQEGLSLDVVSTGELYTAIRAGFPKEKIHLHGNNKTREEFSMAVEEDIGCVVLDNFHDITLLENELGDTQHMDVLMRVTPGVASHTHQYIMTGHEDSKFGFDLFNGQADEAFTRLVSHSNIHLKGLHCHLGSQLTDSSSYTQASARLFKKIRQWHEETGYEPKVMNFGGGFGIQYTDQDPLVRYEEMIASLINDVRGRVKALDIPFPEIWLEPGRAIVGNAGLTLYSVGAIKHLPNIRTYVSVDGGMTDNIRPALYNADYHGVVANKAAKKTSSTVSIAGKCCESGDMLIDELTVPETEPGDILAVYSTGAYGFSMANNYNRFPKPAVVFVEEGRDQLVVRRESLDDIIKNDLSYE
ncbi:Diaminopimelate decarboxylase [Lentibacillus sp. JNUCC-1]|uniref:diaminopimelate decarboxylase n=1 Tax=Lentibacillus sp. JNUCC-1 TaxID=2654513 RepID=UPI0012E8F970|nr:diaminopimelate decarboxylase [Lentibacillus sp. JNUCC-1]MUV39732.1 Diaminopimelate decarboxylase [Lentibacillus sp. JNUCC-1]